MKKSSLLLLSMAAALALPVARPVAAGIAYSYSAGQRNYTVAPGATVDVPVYLNETLTGSSISLITSDGGLGGAGVQIAQTGIPPGSPSTITAITANTTLFAGPVSTTLGTPSSLTEAISLSATTGAPVTIVTGQPAGTTLDQILLGTFAITAGNVGGQTTDFTVGRYAPGGIIGGNTLTLNNFWDLDQTNNAGNAGSTGAAAPTYTGASSSPFAVTTTTVPEPVTLGIFAAGGCMLLLLRRRVPAAR